VFGASPVDLFSLLRAPGALLMPRRRPPPPDVWLDPDAVYREAIALLGGNVFKALGLGEITEETAQRWIAREDAMLEAYGPVLANLAYVRQVTSYQTQTGIHVICGQPLHEGPCWPRRHWEGQEPYDWPTEADWKRGYMFSSPNPERPWDFIHLAEDCRWVGCEFHRDEDW
jgi:hypothetical protein